MKKDLKVLYRLELGQLLGIVTKGTFKGSNSYQAGILADSYQVGSLYLEYGNIEDEFSH